ncbi:MAG TPA: DNA methyltransferase [Halococcus sp.]|nr:DNA methyltransferase [Halococcus sp.]
MSTATGADDDSSTTATEFVIEEFDTSVPKGAVEDLTRTIEQVVSDLRTRITSDDRLETLLRGQPGPDILHGNDITEQGDPEPFTQRRVIEPLFEALGYPDFTTEASGLSDQQRQKADYLFSLREFDAIDSQRLPAEAEPLNKNLNQQKHGIGQVKDWLDTYSFGAEFGIATDGMRWVLIKFDRERYQYDTLAEINLQPVFIAAFENITGRQMSLDEWRDDNTDDLLARFVQSFGFENFIAIASDARSVIDDIKDEITDTFYEEYVHRVFGVIDETDDERTTFALVGDGIIAPEAATGDDERLFAVELMNRLIFIKFLEDRQLVPETLLSDLADTYDPETYPQSLYETYFEPLFFGVLDERPSERTQQIRNVRFYSNVPYLNGGLFRPTVNEERGFTDEDFDVTDAVLDSVIRFLESYTFSADGGPNDLDPSILGNVFEKTINYLTGDADDSKKKLGAFYTPDEITRFCAEETVQPWLLERFKTTMVDELGRERVDMDRYDDVFNLIERAVPRDANVVEPLLDIVDQFRALDPACGSGHFLTSVLGEVVAVRKALYDKHHEDPQTWELRKQTVIENIYGVDIVQPAVEIAKLRLWLSIIAEVNADEIEKYDEDELALPNVVFNVQQGNSLVGYTDLMETNGDSEQMRIDAWGADTVRAKYEEVIEQIRLHKEASDTETAREHLLEAERLREGYRADLDERVLNEFRDAGIEGITPERIAAQQPFHWVLEFAPVYADGGFDVIVGNPPWDQLRPSRDDYFSRFDPTFRTRPPSDKDAKQAELLEDEEKAAGWEEHQREIEIRIKYFSQSKEYQLQKPTVAGRIDPNEKNLAALFLERVFSLARDGGYIGQVLPGVIFNGSFSKDLRLKLLNGTEITALVGFENHGIFEGLHAQYNFAVTTFKNGGRTDALRGIFQQRDIGILSEIGEHTVEIPRQVLIEYSSEARIFPFVSSREEAKTLNAILSHPSLGEHLPDCWNVDPYEEIHRTRDADRFVENEQAGDYPVYGGKNIQQHVYDDTIELGAEPFVFWSVEEHVDPERSAKYRARERTFNSGNLKKSIYLKFNGNETSKSQIQFVNDLLADYRGKPLTPEDALLDCTEYRIAYREIANSTNERTLIAAVLPIGVVHHHKLNSLRPYEISPTEDHLSENPIRGAYKRSFSDKELFVASGLINSLPFDFLMRTKVDSTVVAYKFTESQAPRLTKGDNWFEYIWTRAARLNCYGEAFTEMRERLGGIAPATDETERRRLQAEIDAAAFHAYGLDREETQFVLDDFHRVRSPRLMTEDYFDLVSEKYDDLAEIGPPT